MMINNIICSVEKFFNLFASWLSFDSYDWAWCPVENRNHIDF